MTSRGMGDTEAVAREFPRVENACRACGHAPSTHRIKAHTHAYQSRGGQYPCTGCTCMAFVRRA